MTKPRRVKILDVTNAEIAVLLREVAELLERRAENPFRIGAYRKAAGVVEQLQEPVARIFAESGAAGLERLPGVGKSLSRTIGRLLQNKKLPLLQRLRRTQSGLAALASLPTVGPQLAERIRAELGADSLEELYSAAYDGRLQRVPGVGHKRVQAIRESLAVRLKRTDHPALHPDAVANLPPVADLLAVDREYRQRAAAGHLPLVAPKKFNPTGAAWLPIMHTRRGKRTYCAMFANTSRSHELRHVGDWVVIYCEDKQSPGQWTVITSRYGPLTGKRIVRGRESECETYYAEQAERNEQRRPRGRAILQVKTKPVQLSLLSN